MNKQNIREFVSRSAEEASEGTLSTSGFIVDARSILLDILFDVFPVGELSRPSYVLLWKPYLRHRRHTGRLGTEYGARRREHVTVSEPSAPKQTMRALNVQQFPQNISSGPMPSEPRPRL